MPLFINSLPCQGKSDLNAAQILRHLRQKYVFVKKITTNPFNAPDGSQIPPPRKTRSNSVPGTDYCPWTWGRDEDPARVPRSIVKAVCTGCAHFCRPVDYHHKVLVSRCDKTTGDKVWKWKERILAIAYVYDPYNWFNGCVFDLELFWFFLL